MQDLGAVNREAVSPSGSGDVQSHTAILETNGCAWMIAHMHRTDQASSTRSSCQPTVVCGFPASPAFNARALVRNT
jgi:hypothetical protein